MMMRKKGEQEGEEEKERGRRFNLTYLKHLDTFDNSAQAK